MKREREGRGREQEAERERKSQGREEREMGKVKTERGGLRRVDAYVTLLNE